jgi:mevalonate kinase
MSSADLSLALDSYAKLFANPTTEHLEEIARETVQLQKLAVSVMNATSPTIRTIASDLEHLLQSPHSVMNQEVSILRAAEHYLANHSNEELKGIVRVLSHNQLALGVMCNELSLLSTAAKSPSAPAK